MISKRQKKKRTGLRRAMDQTRTTAQYPGVGQGLAPALSYVGLGLVGEAGEVANQLKKVMRDDGGVLCPAREAKLFDELGDVLWYWLRLCDELGFDPYAVMDHNLAKLSARLRDGTLQGDTALVVDEQVTYQWDEAVMGWRPTEDEEIPVNEASPPDEVPDGGTATAPERFAPPDEELTRLRFKHGITYPPHAEDGDVLDVAGYLATYREGEGWVCEWEHNLLELGPHLVKDGCVVGRDPQTGEPWDGSAALETPTGKYLTAEEAFAALVEAQIMPGHEGREMHLLECHCTCAHGGTAWKVSGYRLLGVTQDMYAHLREQHVVQGKESSDG